MQVHHFKGATELSSLLNCCENKLFSSLESKLLQQFSTHEFFEVFCSILVVLEDRLRLLNLHQRITSWFLLFSLGTRISGFGGHLESHTSSVHRNGVSSKTIIFSWLLPLLQEALKSPALPHPEKVFVHQLIAIVSSSSSAWKVNTALVASPVDEQQQFYHNGDELPHGTGHAGQSSTQGGPPAPWNSRAWCDASALALLSQQTPAEFLADISSGPGRHVAHAEPAGFGLPFVGPPDNPSLSLFSPLTYLSLTEIDVSLDLPSAHLYPDSRPGRPPGACEREEEAPSPSGLQDLPSSASGLASFLTPNDRPARHDSVKAGSGKGGDANGASAGISAISPPPPEVPRAPKRVLKPPDPCSAVNAFPEFYGSAVAITENLRPHHERSTADEHQSISFDSLLEAVLRDCGLDPHLDSLALSASNLHACSPSPLEHSRAVYESSGLAPNPIQSNSSDVDEQSTTGACFSVAPLFSASYTSYRNPWLYNDYDCDYGYDYDYGESHPQMLPCGPPPPPDDLQKVLLYSETRTNGSYEPLGGAQPSNRSNGPPSASITQEQQQQQQQQRKQRGAESQLHSEPFVPVTWIRPVPELLPPLGSESRWLIPDAQLIHKSPAYFFKFEQYSQCQSGENSVPSPSAAITASGAAAPARSSSSSLSKAEPEGPSAPFRFSFLRTPKLQLFETLCSTVDPVPEGADGGGRETATAAPLPALLASSSSSSPASAATAVPQKVPKSQSGSAAPPHLPEPALVLDGMHPEESERLWLVLDSLDKALKGPVLPAQQQQLLTEIEALMAPRESRPPASVMGTSSTSLASVAVVSSPPGAPSSFPSLLSTSPASSGRGPYGRVSSSGVTGAATGRLDGGSNIGAGSRPRDAGDKGASNGSDGTATLPAAVDPTTAGSPPLGFTSVPPSPPPVLCHCHCHCPCSSVVPLPTGGNDATHGLGVDNLRHPFFRFVRTAFIASPLAAQMSYALACLPFLTSYLPASSLNVGELHRKHGLPPPTPGTLAAVDLRTAAGALDAVLCRPPPGSHAIPPGLSLRNYEGVRQQQALREMKECDRMGDHASFCQASRARESQKELSMDPSLLLRPPPLALQILMLSDAVPRELLVLRLGLLPEHVPALVEHVPNVAYELLLQAVRLAADPSLMLGMFPSAPDPVPGAHLHDQVLESAPTTTWGVFPSSDSAHSSASRPSDIVGLSNMYGPLPNLMSYLPSNPSAALLEELQAALGGWSGALLGSLALSSQEVTLQSMEVVNRLAAAAPLPYEFLRLYITHCIRSCEAVQDKYMQTRLVRLVCAFLHSLMRLKLANMRQAAQSQAASAFTPASSSSAAAAAVAAVTLPASAALLLRSHAAGGEGAASLPSYTPVPASPTGASPFPQHDNTVRGMSRTSSYSTVSPVFPLSSSLLQSPPRVPSSSAPFPAAGGASSSSSSKYAQQTAACLAAETALGGGSSSSLGGFSTSACVGEEDGLLLLHEIQAFCINFSKMKEAAKLFRLLKQMEEDGGFAVSLFGGLADRRPAAVATDRQFVGGHFDRDG